MDWNTLGEQLGAWLHQVGIYELNGFFIIGYWIWAHLIQLLSCMTLLGIAVLDLTEAQRTNLSLHGQLPWYQLSALRHTLLTAGLWLLPHF